MKIDQEHLSALMYSRCPTGVSSILSLFHHYLEPIYTYNQLNQMQ